MLKRASLTRSPVGLVVRPDTLDSLVPLALPAMMRKMSTSSPGQAFELACQTGIRLQGGIPSQQPLHLFGGLLQDLAVLPEIRQTEKGLPPLADAKQISGTPQAQVFFCNEKPVIGP